MVHHLSEWLQQRHPNWIRNLRTLMPTRPMMAHNHPYIQIKKNCVTLLRGTLDSLLETNDDIYISHCNPEAGIGAPSHSRAHAHRTSVPCIQKQRHENSQPDIPNSYDILSNNKCPTMCVCVFTILCNSLIPKSKMCAPVFVCENLEQASAAKSRGLQQIHEKQKH